MPTKPRVTHVITGLATGGAEMMLLKLVQNPASTFAHTVISLGSMGALGVPMRRAGATVVALSLKPGRVPFGGARGLAREMRQSEPDVVQGWMYHGNLAATFARAFGGRKAALAWSVRCSFNDNGNDKWLTRKVIDAGAWLSRRPGAIIYNSRRSREQHAAQGYADTQALVIPNGFDLTRFKPNAALRAAARERLGTAPDRIAIGLLARVHPMKDHATLLRAAAEVVRANEQAVFVVAGKGAPNLREQMPDLVQAVGPRLILHPEESDVQAFMNALDICVLSSAWGEAFPNVLGEAMACGVPCVATDVGDCADIVAGTGLIVPPKAPDKLAQALKALASLPPGSRRELGEKARARVADNYALEQVRRNYEEVWRHLVGNLPGAATLRSSI